ncbi:IS5/IS1182 family transposase, partial [Flavobacterium cupreum]
GYTAQAAADGATLLGGATHGTQAPNDKEQIVPMLARIKAQSEVLGMPHDLLADTGYFSGKNVHECEDAQVTPSIAMARDQHHPDWRDRHTEPAPLAAPATAVQEMAHRLKTKAGRALYGLRKQTIEPVFGIIKSVMGFRQFSLRGLDKVNGEWSLVCL